jgi:hypothetical protein
MSQLRLQKRDDPLAIGGPVPEHEEQEARQTTGAEQAPAKALASASPVTRQPRTHRTQRRETKTPGTAAAPRHRRQATPPQHTPRQSQRTYDDDRLEQTGWRIYESLLAEVKARAEELSAAGIPTSAAALAAATLHSYLPRTIADGAEVMRPYRQATAGRQKRHLPYKGSGNTGV